VPVAGGGAAGGAQAKAGDAVKAPPTRSGKSAANRAGPVTARRGGGERSVCVAGRPAGSLVAGLLVAGSLVVGWLVVG